jgi:hypothetical protein
MAHVIAGSNVRRVLLGASQLPGKFDEFIVATGAATPGMNLVPTAAARVQNRDTAAPGASPAAAAANVAGQSGALNIVLERAMIGETIDTPIAVGEIAGTYKPHPGDVVLVLGKLGQTFLKEDLVAFDATGKAVVATVGAVGKSLDASGGALAADAHIRMRVL